MSRSYQLQAAKFNVENRIKHLAIYNQYRKPADWYSIIGFKLADLFIDLTMHTTLSISRILL